jgi:hypothetical protein
MSIFNELIYTTIINNNLIFTFIISYVMTYLWILIFLWFVVVDKLADCGNSNTKTGRWKNLPLDS